ncbi:MAG: hypothetical protein HFJ41_03535 [Clostridia bacterium]|nr:hypothetical protein [Clostridia bacterium]
MKRSIKILLAVIIIMMYIAGTVNAASIAMELKSSSKLVAGDTVVVTLRISNIDVANGVNAMSGKLVYDPNIFEAITEQNYTTAFQGLNSWSVNPMGYNAEQNIFTALRGNNVNMASDVMQIKLKVKSTVTVDSTAIEVKDMEFSGGMETGDINPVDVSIKINKAAQITPEDPNKTNTQQGGQTTQPPKTNTQSPVVNGNNTPTTKLPQTGEEYGIVLAIAVVAIVSIIAYIRYKNVNIK